MEQENNESSNYVELKTTPELPTTSINAIVSTAHKMRRPPSLSESFAWSPVNMTRAAASGTSLNLLIASPSPPPLPRQQSPPPFSHKFIIYTLKFTFHISLISIFESIFFFLYVSTLENNGINVTINYFTNNLVSSCATYTPLERNITNAIIDAFVNASTIVAAGDQEQIVRNTENTKLFNRAWYYVGALSFLFMCVASIAVYKKIQLSWGKLICENFGLVIMLAAYEYMFFSTIIFPYAPLSGAEIARNIVYMLQSRCGLLV